MFKLDDDFHAWALEQLLEWAPTSHSDDIRADLQSPIKELRMSIIPLSNWNPQGAVDLAQDLRDDFDRVWERLACYAAGHWSTAHLCIKLDLEGAGNILITLNQSPEHFIRSRYVA